MSDFADNAPSQSTDTASQLASRAPGLLARSINAHGLLIGLVLVYAGFYTVLMQLNDGIQPKTPLSFALGLVGSSVAFFLFTLFMQQFYKVARYQKPKSATIAIAKGMWSCLRQPKSALLGLPAIAILMPFMFVFVQVKNHITAIKPFFWDETFYHLDKAIHFGLSPWKWLEPLLAHAPVVTAIININYMLWFFVMWMLIVHFAFAAKTPVQRTRFFLSFFLTWAVGGSFLAIVFSSAGPAFYGSLGLETDPYQPLMEILRSANQSFPVWAIELQDQMWKAYNGNGLDVGISAMPSMHNGLALLFVMALWRPQRKFALILSVHAFLIFIGSIWLAWHYAVDAYMAWALSVFFWHLSAPIARWWHTLEPVRDFHAHIEHDLKRSGITRLD